MHISNLRVTKVHVELYQLTNPVLVVNHVCHKWSRIELLSYNETLETTEVMRESSVVNFCFSVCCTNFHPTIDRSTYLVGNLEPARRVIVSWLVSCCVTNLSTIKRGTIGEMLVFIHGYCSGVYWIEHASNSDQLVVNQELEPGIVS